MRRVITASVALLVLATGCTAYHSAGFTGGYRDKQLDDNRYQVAFLYNGPRAVFGGADSVRRYVERRCAELTLEKGMKYFVIESERHTAVPLKLEYVIRLTNAPTDGDKDAREATEVLRTLGTALHRQ